MCYYYNEYMYEFLGQDPGVVLADSGHQVLAPFMVGTSRRILPGMQWFE
eukprot:COSAG02_NODE_39257_length_419_cov_0.881250_1_plen_48_part_10